MGVRGLESFLKKQVVNGVFSVNILDEIDRKKREDPEKPIVLAFQVIDMLYNITLSLKKVELICGPAHRKIHEIFEKCLQELKNLEVDLHFFIDGPIPNYGEETWICKQSDRYKENIALIDAIDSNIPIEEIKEMERRPGATTLLHDLRIICEKYGTWHVALHSRCIVDIVKYSNENDAFAIIGNSSNFLIFNGNWHYWSCRHIGLMEQKWITLEYNKSALLDRIGLTQSKMPLLATIAGNDFVVYDELKEIHKNIHSEENDYFKEHFPRLAEFVAKFSDTLSYEEKREFTKALFRSSDFQHYKMVCDSLNFYTMKMEENVETDSLLLYAASFDRIYYNSLTETPIRMSLPSFYDMRRKDFLPHYKIELPILKRQIGYIRKHKDETNYKHTVILKISHSQPHSCISVKPEYPTVHIPDLEELTFNRTNNYFDNVRFRILKWMVFGNYFHPEFLIQQIPEGYMVTVVAIMYLVKLKQLSTTEADAILLSIHLIHENQDYAADIKGPPQLQITSRDVIVSHTYISLHNVMVNCFLFVGLNNFVDYLQFDGVYFVHWLNEIKTNDCSDILSKIEKFKDFLRFVTD